MDKYDASNDHYCYQGTVTLKNKLNIRDMELLEKAERDITVITAQRIVFNRPPYDLKYMQHLHFQLFQNYTNGQGTA